MYVEAIDCVTCWSHPSKDWSFWLKFGLTCMITMKTLDPVTRKARSVVYRSNKIYIYIKRKKLVSRWCHSERKIVYTCKSSYTILICYNYKTTSHKFKSAAPHRNTRQKHIHETTHLCNYNSIYLNASPHIYVRFV